MKIKVGEWKNMNDKEKMAALEAAAKGREK